MGWNGAMAGGEFLIKFPPTPLGCAPYGMTQGYGEDEFLIGIGCGG